MKLAVFDCDGTLIDSQVNIIRAMESSFQRHGLAPPLLLLRGLHRLRQRLRIVRRYQQPPPPVPQHLRDGHYPGSKRLGHGVGYQYAHDFPGHHVAQDHLGAPRRFYEPSEQGVEKKIKERVTRWRESQSQNP